MRHIILGTAGHIDHGKSSLVKALTGVDPDRLKEEKERGITIDIGFADLVFPENELTVGIVDVPGHEKLVRNMLAGAGGIDMVLLVIAADEGIMPQSREHLAICDLLKIKSGLVAVTKTDLVAKDWLDLVEDEIRTFVKGTFLENSPIIPASSRTGENLEALRSKIGEIALGIKPKSTNGLFRLPIDRVFTLKGFGTVITGTAISGKISLEEALEIMPAGKKSKVRGLHSHGRSIPTAMAGQRVAINLQAIEKEDIRRGDVAVAPSSFSPTVAVDAYIELLPGAPVIKNRSLVHFYAGTSETIARIILYGTTELHPGEESYCQFRLREPIVAVSGDRYIIRRFSPLETLGGGEVLDPSPLRRRHKEGTEDLVIFKNGDLSQKISKKIENAGARGILIGSLQGWINAELDKIAESIENLKRTGEIIQHEDLVLHNKALSLVSRKVLDVLKSYHEKNPLKPGMHKEEARNQLRIDPKLFNFILSNLSSQKAIIVDKNFIRRADFKIALSSGEEINKEKILKMLRESGFQPPLKDELASALKIDQKHLSDILGIMAKEGSITRISDSLYISAEAYKDMISALKSFFLKKNELSVAEFRDLLKTSRKYALPFLEYLDSHKVTIRTGDVRKSMMKGE
jgi:selenocysteine-specific elongation factor